MAKRDLLTASQKVRRDLELVRLRLEFPSRTWDWIIEQLVDFDPRWKLTDRACREIYAEWRKESAEDLAHPDALEIVQEHIAGFRLIRERLAETARDAAGGIAHVIDDKGAERELIFKPQPNVVVGALNKIAELRQKEIALLQETGLLPKNLGRLELELDQRYTVQVFLEIMSKYLTPKERQEVELLLVEALSASRLPGREVAQPALSSGS